MKSDVFVDIGVIEHRFVLFCLLFISNFAHVSQQIFVGDIVIEMSN